MNKIRRFGPEDLRQFEMIVHAHENNATLALGCTKLGSGIYHNHNNSNFSTQ